MDPFLTILSGLPTTIALSVLALVGGGLVALPLMLARRSRMALVRFPASALIDVLRAVPPIVWLFIIFFGLAETGITLSPFVAAAVGLGAISAGYLAEVYRGGLMAVDKGQWEAGQALGLHTRDSYRFVLAPQAWRAALPAAATYAIGLIKDTAIAYTIGVNEILFEANHEAQLGTASPLAILAFAGALYAVLSVAVGAATRQLDRRLHAVTAR
jgi:polar amino acid transport system permease protein